MSKCFSPFFPFWVGRGCWFLGRWAAEPVPRAARVQRYGQACWCDDRCGPLLCFLLYFWQDREAGFHAEWGSLFQLMCVSAPCSVGHKFVTNVEAVVRYVDSHQLTSIDAPSAWLLCPLAMVMLSPVCMYLFRC